MRTSEWRRRWMREKINTISTCVVYLHHLQSHLKIVFAVFDMQLQACYKHSLHFILNYIIYRVRKLVIKHIRSCNRYEKHLGIKKVKKRFIPLYLAKNSGRLNRFLRYRNVLYKLIRDSKGYSRC